MTFWNGSGSWSAYPQHWNYGSGFRSLFYFTFEGTFTSVFKDRKSEKSHKNSIIKVFLLFCLIVRGSGSVQIMTGTDSGGPKYSDPTNPDPDPQHWQYAAQTRIKWKNIEKDQLIPQYNNENWTAVWNSSYQKPSSTTSLYSTGTICWPNSCKVKWQTLKTVSLI